MYLYIQNYTNKDLSISIYAEIHINMIVGDVRIAVSVTWTDGIGHPSACGETRWRSLILVQPGERAKPWRKDYKEPGPTDYNYNLQFQREQSDWFWSFVSFCCNPWNKMGWGPLFPMDFHIFVMGWFTNEVNLSDWSTKRWKREHLVTVLKLSELISTHRQPRCRFCVRLSMLATRTRGPRPRHESCAQFSEAQIP